jgi:hypothetical protein
VWFLAQGCEIALSRESALAFNMKALRHKNTDEIKAGGRYCVRPSDNLSCPEVLGMWIVSA